MTPTRAILLFLSGAGDDAGPQVARIRRAVTDPASDPEAAEHLAAFRHKAATLLTRPNVVAAVEKRRRAEYAAFYQAVSDQAPEVADLLSPPADSKREHQFFARLVQYLAERYPADQPPPDRSSAESLASSVFASYLGGGRGAASLDDPQDPWAVLLAITTRKLNAGAEAVQGRWQVGGGPDAAFLGECEEAYTAECRSLLAGTPDTDKRAIVAGRLLGQSVEELAKQTGKSNAFVKMTLKQAHRKLTEKYAAAC